MASAPGLPLWPVGPHPYLIEAAGEQVRQFELPEYRDWAFVDPSAPRMESKYWVVWGGTF